MATLFFSMQHETGNTVSFYVLYFLLVYNLHVEFFHWFSPGNTKDKAWEIILHQPVFQSKFLFTLYSAVIFFISEFLVLQFCPLLFKEVSIGNISPCSLPSGLELGEPHGRDAGADLVWDCVWSAPCLSPMGLLCSGKNLHKLSPNMKVQLACKAVGFPFVFAAKQVFCLHSFCL